MNTASDPRVQTPPSAHSATKRGSAPAFYYRARRVLAWSADRVTHWCDQQARTSYGVEPSWLQLPLRHALVATGSWARVIGLLPRLDARLIVGPRWRVAYIGDMTMFREFVHAFVPDAVAIEALPRVPAWRVSAAAAGLVGHAELVVCGLPARWPRPWRPRAPWLARTPIFVEMFAPLEGTSLTEWAHGGAHRPLRRDITLATRVGFALRSTRSREDIEWFYRALYEPHVRRRHGDRAIVSSADAHWRDWIGRGGEMILLDLDGRAVAGVIVADHGVTRFLGEEGLSPDLTGTIAGARAQTALRAFAIEQALAKGLQTVSLGRSLGRNSDRGLAHKRRWRGAPRPPERSHYPVWTLLAPTLPRDLSDHLEGLQLLDFDDLSKTIALPPVG